MFFTAKIALQVTRSGQIASCDMALSGQPKWTHNAGKVVIEDYDFQNFPGEHAPGPPSGSRIRRSFFHSQHFNSTNPRRWNPATGLKTFLLSHVVKNKVLIQRIKSSRTSNPSILYTIYYPGYKCRIAMPSSDWTTAFPPQLALWQTCFKDGVLNFIHQDFEANYYKYLKTIRWN